MHCYEISEGREEGIRMSVIGDRLGVLVGTGGSTQAVLLDERYQGTVERLMAKYKLSTLPTLTDVAVSSSGEIDDPQQYLRRRRVSNTALVKVYTAAGPLSDTSLEPLTGTGLRFTRRVRRGDSWVSTSFIDSKGRAPRGIEVLAIGHGHYGQECLMRMRHGARFDINRGGFLYPFNSNQMAPATLHVEWGHHGLGVAPPGGWTRWEQWRERQMLGNSFARPARA